MPLSPGRSSALPPKETTARGRTNEKNRDVIPGPTGSDVLANQGHGHAARSAAGPGKLVSCQTDYRLLAGLDRELLAAEKQVLLVDDGVPGARKLLDRLDVAVIKQDHPGRH